MSAKVRISAVIFGLVGLWFAAPAFGDTVTIDFTGVANTSVQALGAYAGYYTGSVNGVTDSPGFICDDYDNEIFLPGESWQATANSFASLATMTTSELDSSTLFGATIGLDGYAALANLATQMETATPAEQANISAAIWYIGVLNGGDPVPWGDLTSAQQALVTEMIGLYGNFTGGSDSAAAIAELDASSLWLYTPTGADITPDYDPFPQEFIGNVPGDDPPDPPDPVPDGGAGFMYLLLAALTCGGAMFCRYRDEFRCVAIGVR